MLPVETHAHIDQFTDGFRKAQHALGVDCAFCLGHFARVRSRLRRGSHSLAKRTLTVQYAVPTTLAAFRPAIHIERYNSLRFSGDSFQARYVSTSRFILKGCAMNKAKVVFLSTFLAWRLY